jgi:hypothetical protein
VREKSGKCEMGVSLNNPLRGTGKGFKKEKCRKVDLNKFL